MRQGENLKAMVTLEEPELEIRKIFMNVKEP